MIFSNIGIPENIIEGFTYTLNPPKTLNTMNIADMVTNADQLVSAAIKAKTGENSEQTDDDNKIKDFMYNTLMREYLPMVNWATVDAAYDAAKISLAEFRSNKSIGNSTNSDNNSNY